MATLNVGGGKLSFDADDAIGIFERETKIALPAGFKEYCRLFDSGMHGDEFRIYCPKHAWDSKS